MTTKKAQTFYVQDPNGTFQRIIMAGTVREPPKKAKVLSNAFYFDGGFVGNAVLDENKMIHALKRAPVTRIGPMTADERRARLLDDLQNPIFLTDSYKVSHWKMYP